ncbi:MAG: L-rhamnose mutarotase [Spirochaetia bacterium]
MKNRYCFVIEINEDHMDDYVSLHKNPWPETLKGLKDAGADELIIFRYKNLSILFYECEDINEVYRKWGANETCAKWNARLKDAYKVAPNIDGSGDVATLEKIFDLNQQLRGKLEPH